MNFGTIQVANIFVGTLNAIEAYFGTEKVWGKSEPATPNWLCFTAEEANSTVAMKTNGSAPAVSLEYSTDGNTWSPFQVGTTTVTLANIEDKMYVRSTSAGNTGMGRSMSDYNQFVMTGKISASGNVNTLLDKNGNATLTDYCYSYLFQGCASLTSAPVLPATKLASGCYYGMFRACDSLTSAPELHATTLAHSCYRGMFARCLALGSAPELPATKLGDYCYNNMFYGCTSLTTAPALPATKLGAGCYANMFSDCRSLTTAPRLPATTLANHCYGSMFANCSSLTSAPELPATTMAADCYSSMFVNCSSLTTAPELPATTLARRCYDDMFGGCSSLTTAPELPATTLAENCYQSMFSICTSLTSAPRLPATTLANFCYHEMFSSCTSLTQAPELPATTLYFGCYYGMFDNCSSLTSAPELPATTLASSCYPNMFKGCRSLTTAPRLPATTLVDGCYNGMFIDCYNLNSITLDYTGDFSTKFFQDWVYGVSSEGTFYYGGSDTKTGVSAIPEGWTVVAPLCFTAEEANSTLHLDKVGTPNAISLETSTDGNTWSDYSWTDKTGDTLTLANIGDKVYMRAKNENQTIGSSNTDYYKFVMTGKIAESGNIQTLLKSDGSRTDAPAYCYKNLFNGCQSLTTTQSLPATTLAAGCYSNMFDGCSSLTTAPVLPATTLAAGCYKEMFKGCTSLTTAPALLVTTLDNGCYSGMFYDCSSLTQAPELPATTLAFGCYQNMFRNCTSLTTSPRLRATTLAPSCYQGVFYGCSNLNTITLDYTGNFSTDYFNYWVYGVASTGTFYYNGTDTTTGVSAIPSGWTKLPIPIPRQELCFTAEEPGSSVAMMDTMGMAPAVSLEYSTDGNTWSPFEVGTTTVTLANIGDKMYMRATSAGNSEICSLDGPNQFNMTGRIAASGNVDTLLDQNGNATLNDHCYYRLFGDCSSLTTAPELPATTLAYGCYQEMFQNCSTLDTIKLGYTGSFDPMFFENWVQGVAPEGTLYYNGSDIQEGDSAIPFGWTVTPFTS